MKRVPWKDEGFQNAAEASSFPARRDAGEYSTKGLLLGICMSTLVGTTCTLLVDRSNVQCRQDSDCAQMFSGEGHPVCVSSVCARSGYAPLSCVLSTPDMPPATPNDFLDQCSKTFLPDPQPIRGGEECLSFDNCKRLGSCGDAGTGAGGAAPLMAPPAPVVATASPDAGIPDDSSLPSCVDSNADRDSVVFISGSSNFIALLTKIAPIIIAKTGLTPVFKTTDSCTGARSMYPCTPSANVVCRGGFSASDHYISDPAPGSSAAHAQYFDDEGPHDCVLGAATAVDVGESEISVETCELQRDDTHVRHTPGPILPILFVVPRNSSQSSISAEAARQVFGNGGGVEPWTRPDYFYIRGPGTATTRLIGKAIDVPVPPNRLWGIDQGTAQKLAVNLRANTDVDVAMASIGLLGADSYDADRYNLKALAFKAKGQTCAYVPDSSLASFDKRNVRDGHYPIWGTVHFFAAIAQGAYVMPAAEKFVELLSVQPRPDDLLNAFIDSGWVPECAMTVTHQNDLTDPMVIRSPFPCGCYFESRVPGGRAPDGCHACVVNADCKDPSRPMCNYHFCEAAPPP